MILNVALNRPQEDSKRSTENLYLLLLVVGESHGGRLKKSWESEKEGEDGARAGVERVGRACEGVLEFRKFKEWKPNLKADMFLLTV